MAVLLAAALLVALVVPCAALAFESPNDPSSGELVEQPKKYDGTEVTFEGEAIGERMVRGDDAWIHLNDDAYMYKNVEEGAALGGYNSGMPVWLPAELAEKIGIFGDYKHEGDIVRVSGTFNAACAQHGGDMDIHATTLDVTTPGRDALDPVKPWKVVAALGLTLAAAGMWYSERRVSHRERRGLAKRG
jgi:hypothetical protein